MTMSDDERNHPQPARMIYDTRRYVQQIRNRFWEEGVNGGFSPSTKRRLATAAIQYWDMLYEFRSESILDDGDFPDISPVRDRIGRQTEVVTKSKRLGQSTTLKTAPAITELSDWYLVELTKELDDLAKKLGFAATTTDRVPNDRASEEDLKGLLEARGQTEAVENLPSQQEADD